MPRATQKHTVLITGPTSGIGESLARLFARDGHDLVLVARTADKLEALAAEFSAAHGTTCHVVPADLAQPSASRDVFDRLQTLDVRVDILVNNAGFTVFGEFLETSGRAELDMLNVNVVALTHMTKLFLAQLTRPYRGRVLNVASTAAFQPGPLMAVYYATKAYVLSFSDALSSELEGTGITVTTLCPGPSSTKFSERGGAGNSKLFKDRKLMSADEVAAIGYRALMRGQSMVIAGRMNAIMAFATRFTPRWMLKRITRYLQSPV